MGKIWNTSFAIWRKWWEEGMLNAVSSPFAESNSLSIRRPTQENLMRWIDDHLIEFDDVTIKLDHKSARESPDSTRQQFVLAKTRKIIDRYQNNLKSEKTERILELGIFKGGSAILYYKMLNPKKLVAVDLYKTRVAALDEYISATHTEDIIKPYYGVNQADKQSLTDIIKSEFGDESIDVVFDDASHWHAESKASFNAIFPFLRSGGYYIIEDWGWAHWPGDRWQKNGGIWIDKPALSNLIIELIMLCASRSDLVAGLDINHNGTIIKKGPAVNLDADFDISRLYNNRGKKAWEPI